MEGNSNKQMLPYEVQESTDHEDLWRDILDDSLLDLEFGDLTEANITEQSTSTKDGTSEDALPFLTTESSQGARKKKKEEQGQSYMKRELGYARARLQRSKMMLKEWQDLLDINDPQALKIKFDFEKRCRREMHCSNIRRKMKKFPNDESLVTLLRCHEEGDEEYAKRRRNWGKRKPMSKHYRDKVDSLIRKVRKEIEDFNRNQQWGGLRSSTTEKRLKQKANSEKKRVLNPNCAEGDAAAEYIIGKIDELRLMFREAPLDESYWGAHWKEIDEWMQVDQLRYVPLERPTIRNELKYPDGWIAVEAEGEKVYIPEGSSYDHSENPSWGQTQSIMGGDSSQVH